MNNHAKRIRLVANMRADLRILESALQLTNPRASAHAEAAGEEIGKLYAAMTMLDEPTEERIDEIRGAT